MQLNLRQKMIACFTLHMIFYFFVGISFLKDFKVFNNDVMMLMNAGNFSNICLEIRRYEKNYIIGHEEEDFQIALGYVDEAINYIPSLINDLEIMLHPYHLNNLKTKIEEYRKALEFFGATCSQESSNPECSSLIKLRSLGQEIVQISTDLVKFEQQKMREFIETFKVQLLRSVSVMITLIIFTLILLYINIVLPLKLIEKAAKRIPKGTFTQLPVSQKKDEVSSVLNAFNRMVVELEEQQEQLFHAEKLSAIGTLASGTAHQINNPLNNISTSCQLALSELESGDYQFVKKMLQTIEQETERAGGIVRGLLEFSRAQTFSMQPVLFDDVVKRALRLVASEVPPGITMEHTIPPGLILRIDIQKMVEALLNLLINAIQSINKPRGTVSITASVDEASDQAIITVEDSGEGIDEKYVQKIFDPFFTTKNVDKGTGLGLAVVYGIIKKQSGSTRVESVKGQGTRIIITLPICHEPAHLTTGLEI